MTAAGGSGPTIAVPGLRPEHLDHLRASGLDDATIAEAGIHSLDPAAAASVGFPRRLRGIGFPYPGTEVTIAGKKVPYYRLRVDPDCVRHEGQKYENPLKNRIEQGLTFYPYVPPRAADLRKRADVPIFVTEGEKKALKLTQEGFHCIGLPGVFMFTDPESKERPADKPLHREFTRWRLRGRVVYVCFDSDRAQKDNVCLAQERLCRRLTEVGALVRVIAIPSESLVSKVGADDFLVDRGREAFQQLVEDARPWLPGAAFLDLIPDDLPVGAVRVALEALAPKLRGASRAERNAVIDEARRRHPALSSGEILRSITGARGRTISEAEPPPIQVNDRQIRDIADEAWTVLLRSDAGRQLFRRGRDLLYLERHRRCSLVPVDAALMGALLNRCATWIAVTDTGERNASVRPDVLRDMLAIIDDQVRELDGVVHVPVFSSDGRLIHEEGYAETDRLYHAVDPALEGVGERVSRSPTPSEMESARSLILGDLLGDFPFVSRSARAHAVATLLQSFVRRLITSPTPLYLIEAPSEGTGKGLLASVIQLCVTGRTPPVTTLPRSEAEVRKKITALLLLAPLFIFFDNVRHKIDSASLAAALTVMEWVDRRLNHSEVIQLPNRTAWMLAANNPVCSGEIARRTVRIRLDAGVEDAWRRTDFRHPQLLAWVKSNRPRLVHAALTLVQSWLAAGRPPGHETLGSFESWASVLGGILTHAGIDGFLADQTERAILIDPEEAEWADLIRRWFEASGEQLLDSKDVMKLAAKAGLLNLDSTSATDPAARSRFSRGLASRRDRVYGRLQITVCRDAKRRQNRYRLVQVREVERREVQDDGESTRVR